MNINKIFVGRVKWYDFDKALDFIQQLDMVTGTPNFNVFVHKTGIRSKNTNYESLKLITGEIVQFNKKPPQVGKNQAQAVNVTGFLNCPLLCDFGKVEMTNY